MTVETRSASLNSVDQAAQTLIDLVHAKCLERINRLLANGIMQEVLTEDEIHGRIDTYLANHASDFDEFIHGSGKVLIVLNSAKKFADYVVQKLGIDSQRISEVRISTYKDGVSQEIDIDDSTKQALAEKMQLTKGDRVLILEDMIDTGNLTQRLFDFLEGIGVDAQMLCLFDKNVAKSDAIKARLGNRLKKIIDIGEEFIVGFGIDWSHRLCSQVPGLLKVNSAVEFTKALEDLKAAINDILAVKKRMATL